MQSTGQTSTHERSLVLMHGSAIMYVIQHLHCQWTNSSYECGPPVVNRSRTNVIAALALFAPCDCRVRSGQDKSPARVADGDGILCAEGCDMARIVETPPVPDRRFDIAGYDAIDTAALETFAYEYPGRDVAVDIETDEFTAVCPWSGLPDFGTVKIRYLPGGKILELRSLKYYLLSYRNVGIYQEHAVTRMLDDLVTTVEPRWMEISLDYKIRGGIHTVCRVRYPHLENA